MSRVSANMARPALSGRYGEIASFQPDGRSRSSGGMTKKMAANVAMPPAVLRTIAPTASAKMPTRTR